MSQEFMDRAGGGGTGAEGASRRRSRSDGPSGIEVGVDLSSGVREAGDREGVGLPTVRKRRRGKRLVKPSSERTTFTPEQRLLILDTWQRSGLPAGDFSSIVGVSMHSLYLWKRRFEADGPAGLSHQRRGVRRESAIPEVTRRSILMLKESHPEWGCQRISDLLARGPGLSASPTTVSKVLKDEGYELEELTVPSNAPPVKRFERARANELWQTDLFTFVLKRQNRRVYLVAFLDDHSRFIVSYGLHASQSTPLVLEVFRSAMTSYGPPKEVLTDNGSQYVTWRGKSAFAKECEKKGIAHIVARPRHPQTLGKTERFWGTLWRELLEGAIFVDLADAQKRIGFFVDWYNFQRPHQGIDGLVPADRFFEAAPQVHEGMKQRIAANALDIARHGQPKEPFYLTGNVGGQQISVHAEGDRVYLRDETGERREVDLVRPTSAVVESPVSVDGSPDTGGLGNEAERPPGMSVLEGPAHEVVDEGGLDE